MPRAKPPRFVRFIRRNALRIFVASILSSVIVSLGVAAMFVTGAPEAVSLSVEPLSLLLIPGVLLSTIPGGHTYARMTVPGASLLFYFLLSYAALSWREERRRRRSDARSPVPDQAPDQTPDGTR